MLAGRNRLVLLLIFLFLYVPFVLDHGFLATDQRNIDLPSFYYASEAAFVKHISPYTPAAVQSLQQQLNQTVFPYLYPPPSLLFFAPFSKLPYATAKNVMLVGNHLALLALLYLLLFRIITRARPWRSPGADGGMSHLFGWLTVPLLVLYALRFHPVAVTLGHGQINLLVLVLLGLFWIGLRERKPGVVTALPLAAAILLKTYPALFLPLLVIRRRWRTAAWTMGYVTAMVLLSWLVLPHEAWRDWLEFVLPSGGYANTPAGSMSPAMPWNQSINGFAARLFLHPAYAAHPNPAAARLLPWTMALLVSMALVFLATRLTRRRETRYLNDEFVMVLLSMFLLAPLSWEHHLVFVLPAAMLALVHILTGHMTWRSAVPVGLSVFVLAWPLEFLFEIQTTGPRALLVSLKFYAVVILWLYYARRLWKVSCGETVDGAEDPAPVPEVS